MAPVATPEVDSTEHLEKPEEPSPLASATSPTCKTASTASLRQVAAFGLQRFPQTSSSTSTTEDWHAVVALKNGRLHLLTIPTLRRILKG